MTITTPCSSSYASSGRRIRYWWNHRLFGLRIGVADVRIEMAHVGWPGAKIWHTSFSADGAAFKPRVGRSRVTLDRPIRFVEEVRADDGSVRRIHQKVMSYKREVGVLLSKISS